MMTVSLRPYHKGLTLEAPSKLHAQCWLYKKTGRLWCPVLNHALFNLTNLILLFILPEPA